MKKKYFVFMATVVVVLCSLLSGCGDIFQNSGSIDYARKKACSDEFYSTLTEAEQAAFDGKLQAIVDSTYFQSLDKKQRDELIFKFVESEKTIKEVSEDPVDKTPEEIQNKIDDKQNELDQVKQELEDLKNSGASDQEIATAQEKQQQVEDQIKSAEQEKAYWETVSTTKDAVNSNTYFQGSTGCSIRKINGIYTDGRRYYINADLIKEENIGGFTYKSKQNQYIQITTTQPPTGNETYEEILTLISEGAGISSEQICVNKNLQSHKDYFEKNKETMNNPVIEYYLSQNYKFTVIDSWECEGDEHPNYVLKIQSDDDIKYFFLTYTANRDKYVTLEVQKACPEFWNQLEIEQRGQNIA